MGCESLEPPEADLLEVEILGILVQYVPFTVLYPVCCSHAPPVRETVLYDATEAIGVVMRRNVPICYDVAEESPIPDLVPNRELLKRFSRRTKVI